MTFRLRTAPELDRDRFPTDAWKLVETSLESHDLGLTETLFATTNGFLGLRGNAPEGTCASSHGTYLNGFHETWPIEYPETAHALATVGQTIVNAPDAKVMRLAIDGETFSAATANISDYERTLDFRTGLVSRRLIWTTSTGTRVAVRSTRMVSLVRRNLAVLTLEVEALDSDAPVMLVSEVLNRETGSPHEQGDCHDADVDPESDAEHDPRRAREFTHRILYPTIQEHDPEPRDGGSVVLGFTTARSGMHLHVGCRHQVEAPARHTVTTNVQEDQATTILAGELRAGETFRVTKYVSYHAAPEPDGLSDRCRETVDEAAAVGSETLYAEQHDRLAEFWEASDVAVGDPELQQAIRWNLWQLAQATIAADGGGVPAKGLTGSGYDGQYFWDTEVYVVPFLALTNPEAAKALIRFRHDSIAEAYKRADEMGHPGALFPWRTINGQEASAYYPAGTAQYHLGSAIAYAIGAIDEATNDDAFLIDAAAEVLVGIARVFEDLGFHASHGARSFHIHGVTGPDEYSAIVNDNFYTNLMARYTLRLAADVVDRIHALGSEPFALLQSRTGIDADELVRWRAAADSMYLPYDKGLGIHLQDAAFLERERWDFEGTPPEKYPLLLHFHPLNIYRKQVLKQPDVVMAMALQPDGFSVEQRHRNFTYYDSLTTGDSSLSRCIQALAAASVGELDLAHEYFIDAAYIDVADTHANTSEGVHIANAGGIWAALVRGFGGFSDRGTYVELTPNVPDALGTISFNVTLRGTALRIHASTREVTVDVVRGKPIDVVVGEDRRTVAENAVFPRPADAGPR